MAGTKKCHQILFGLQIYSEYRSVLEIQREFGEGLFVRECSDRTRSNGFKLEGTFREGTFRLKEALKRVHLD